MAQEKEVKTRGRKKGTVVTHKQSEELKAVIIAAKKLNYDDLESLSNSIIATLKDRHNKELKSLEEKIEKLKAKKFPA
jgi:DNA-binding protein YbaB